MYDYKIVNGLVFDSLQGVFKQNNLYIKDSIVEEISDIDHEAKSVIDAQDKFVCPGFVDEHLHLDYQGSLIGVNGDTVCIPNGVTTACDGGTCGVSNFPLFYRSNIIRYEADTYAYLNVSTFGNKSLCIHEEDHDPLDFRFDLIEKCFEKYGDVIRGLKVRMCQGTLGDSLGLAPLLATLEMSEKLKQKGYRCPIVVHYDNLPANVKVDDLFGALRKDDIIAHVFQNKRETIFDSDGRIKDSVISARNRGVIMDDCHGRVHWTIKHLKNAFKQEFFPDIISSDAVRISEYVRPGFSLLYALNMDIACGMSFERALQAVTINPVKALGLDKVGKIFEGGIADVTIIEKMKIKTSLFDNCGDSIAVENLVTPLLTMKSGRVAFRQLYF